MGGVNDLATAGAFGPYARVTASGLIVDDCVPTRDCLAAEEQSPRTVSGSSGVILTSSRAIFRGRGSL